MFTLNFEVVSNLTGNDVINNSTLFQCDKLRIAVNLCTFCFLFHADRKFNFVTQEGIKILKTMLFNMKYINLIN